MHCLFSDAEKHVLIMRIINFASPAVDISVASAYAHHQSCNFQSRHIVSRLPGQSARHTKSQSLQNKRISRAPAAPCFAPPQRMASRRAVTLAALKRETLIGQVNGKSSSTLKKTFLALRALSLHLSRKFFLHAFPPLAWLKQVCRHDRVSCCTPLWYLHPHLWLCGTCT